MRLNKHERVWTLKLKIQCSGYSRSSRPVSRLRMPRSKEPAKMRPREYLPGGKKEQEALEFKDYSRGMFKWQETGTCPYGDHCLFDRGISELRAAITHPHYKTEVCGMVLAGDTGPYGQSSPVMRRSSTYTNTMSSNEDEDDSDDEGCSNYPEEDEDYSDRYNSEDMDYPYEDERDDEEEVMDSTEEEDEGRGDNNKLFKIYIILHGAYEFGRRPWIWEPKTTEKVASLNIDQLTGYDSFTEAVHKERMNEAFE